MFVFLEKIFSWRPFGRKRRKHRRSDWRGERIISAVDLARDRRPPVPRRDVVIGALAGLNLVMLPWFVSGLPLWAQFISLALSTGAFAFLFLPVGYDEWRSASPRKSLDAVRGCVPFWCGVFLMGLFLLQGLNPRLTVESDGTLWQLLPADHVAWLPSGVDAPTLVSDGYPGCRNAWCAMLLFAPMWLTFTALWCGVRSRRVTSWLVRSVLASTVALAVFSIGMRAAGDQMLYNTISIYIGSVYGPFTYQNQAGAFFYMAALLAAGMALREWRAASGPVMRGGSYFVLAATACLLAGAAVYSASFAAVGGLFAGVVILLPAWWFSRPKREDATGRSWTGIFVVVVLIVGLCAVVALFSDIRPVWEKLMHKFHLMDEAKIDDRAGMRAATWAMFKEAAPKVFGSGAGSFRWISPEYFARFKEFRDASGVLVMRANYAHFDWLQMLTEWGVAGIAAVMTLLGWTLNRLRISKIWKQAFVWPVLAGCVILMAHASFDYLFFNPAVNLLFAFLAFVGLAWSREAKA